MSYPGPIARPNRDAFGRIRISQATELFSKALEYDDAPLFYENVTSGGTATFDADTASVDLEVSGAGDRVIRQSRQYVRYRPGKSQQIFVTGNFEGQETGVIKRIGYYDDDSQPGSTGDGLFFEVSGTEINVVRRSSSTTGSSVDTKTAQASWNVDPLDSTGPSGLTLDVDKFVVCVFEFGWLGGAVVRWGFVINGEIIIVHEEFPSNTLAVPFTRRPSLPVRWEISGDAGAATGSMKATCASVQSEGGFNTLGVRRSASREGTGLTLSATTLVPLLSVRLGPGYLRALADPQSFSVLADGNAPHEILVIVNGTLTNDTWGAGTSGIMEVDTAATAVSGGRLLHSQYAPGGTGGFFLSGDAAVTGSLLSDVPLASTYDGTPDTLTLAVRPLTSDSTDFYGSIDWREFY